MEHDNHPSGSQLDSENRIPPELSRPAVGRLSLYFRELHHLLEIQTTNINSQELGKLVDVSPAVVRRDLSSLGSIGRRGVGYSVETLIEQIGAALGSGLQWKAVLVGVGSLGDALLRYRGFERLGFEVTAAFDNDPQRIDQVVSGVKVYDVARMSDVLKAKQPELAIIAVPAGQAAEIAAKLVSSKVHGILNFAPTTLKLPPRIAVVNVDLASELQRLAFRVREQQ